MGWIVHRDQGLVDKGLPDNCRCCTAKGAMPWLECSTPGTVAKVQLKEALDELRPGRMPINHVIVAAAAQFLSNGVEERLDHAVGPLLARQRPPGGSEEMTGIKVPANLVSPLRSSRPPCFN